MATSDLLKGQDWSPVEDSLKKESDSLLKGQDWSPAADGAPLTKIIQAPWEESEKEWNDLLKSKANYSAIGCHYQ